MTGERWPDKRARAVLVAGANKLAREGAAVAPDAVGDLGLAIREHLFVDAEVREETQSAKEHTIGYSRDCMQYALLAPAANGVALSLWVGSDVAAEACAAIDGAPDPNALRRMFGWVRCVIPSPDRVHAVVPWVARSVAHAEAVKKTQGASGMA